MIKDNNAYNVLAIFAHPDDAELSCFGTLMKLSLKNEVYVLEITHGESSKGNVSLRNAETNLAASLGGYKLFQESFPDGSLEYKIELISIIENYINKIKPKIVITHFPQKSGNGHQDHVVVSDASVNAARRSSFVDCIFYSEPPVQITNFYPNLFVDISKYIEKKCEAINIHNSEINKNYISTDITYHKAKMWAFEAYPGFFDENKFFEAFKVVKMIIE